MDKDTTYWNTHKMVWDELLSEIDTEIVTKIYNNPNCHEGRLFSRRVNSEVEKRLQLQTD